jgi:formate hydrogenlyase subunit 3/multisubunit Na+/H+ antiporter MnhD subunit
MELLLCALCVLLAGGFGAILARRSRYWTTWVGACTTVSACVLGTIPAMRALLGGSISPLSLAWSVPYGAFSVGLDALSAVFLIAIFALAALSAVYGAAYVRASGYAPARSWFFFNMLVAGMVLLLIARNAVLFLMAWEGMTIASFFLITMYDTDEAVQEAGWTYLVATHLGTAFLLVLFVLLGRDSGSLDFNRFAVPPGTADLLFVLAVIGFGTKAGFVPFHVWLPEAHPAAPSHVSALMSGVMIKTGIYGLLRVLTVLGSPAAWWGWLLCAIGVSSAVVGVVFALAQHDLKRLLAYHSVENIGIVALGIGVGLLGVCDGRPTVAVAGFTGALLHVINHAGFKGLLFLGAGAVAHATGTREIDRLGGLIKTMPWTGLAFVIGAAAISGLPPLNGFISEWLIYSGSLEALSETGDTAVAPHLAVVAGLALIGGLATACFAKAFGIVFLGEARSREAERAHECPGAMLIPMLVLALACVLIGLLAPVVVGALQPAVAQLANLPADTLSTSLASIVRPLAGVTRVALALMGTAALVAVARRYLLGRRRADIGVTWDCGYATPTPRMQYTASSFAQPLTALFAALLRPHTDHEGPRGLFPEHARFSTHTADVFAQRVYQPVFVGVGQWLSALRWLQHGQTHLYILYIALTLLVLLVWKLG